MLDVEIVWLPQRAQHNFAELFSSDKEQIKRLLQLLCLPLATGFKKRVFKSP